MCRYREHSAQASSSLSKNERNRITALPHEKFFMISEKSTSILLCKKAFQMAVSNLPTLVDSGDIASLQ